MAPGDPEAAHMVAALGGRAQEPARARDAYVRTLFDSFAGDFDRLLTTELDYRAPDLLYRAVTAALTRETANLNVLDLGCGTGLAGEKFRPLARHLSGVDLSREMVKRARARGIYDTLRVGELVDALAGTPARYDLVLAADVLVYFGDLAPVFRAVSARLTPGGLFAFTVEIGDAADHTLMQTGRFAHHPDYIRRVVTASAMREHSLGRAVLRSESGSPVEGLVVVIGNR